MRWSAYEHEHIERGADWFWALGVIAVCAALIALLFHDVLFSIVLLIAALTIGMMARTPPELARFEISDRGVRINGVLHRYHEIISFWVEEEKERPLLLIDTVKFLSPNLIIPIEEVDPHAVRMLLRAHAKEVHMREPLSHKLLEAFGL